jgi:16S rRNA (cytidine1402-2'-O)-methyltransferase
LRFLEKGILYLFPVTLGDTRAEQVIPLYNIDLIKNISVFIAEDAKSARRFLKLCQYPDISKAEILLLNEHTKEAELSSLLKPLLDGINIGLLSDAGCPGIADPGSDLVKRAHQNAVKVVPLVGPSSIVLTIMAAGFNGQNFSFNGYLPVDKHARTRKIKELEQLAFKQNQSQFFIETPYRNNQMMEDLLQSLQLETRLCIGVNLTLPSEKVVTRTVSEWKKITKPDLHKIPVVFGIYK